jgi:DNA-binding CsgD family transcriptional regulator
MAISFVVSLFALLLFVGGATIMMVVRLTRIRHPAMTIYLKLLAVLFAHWTLSCLVVFLGNLQGAPLQMVDLLLLPRSQLWIALVSVPERFLLAWEIYLTLLSAFVSTKSLGGRPGRRRLMLVFVFLAAFLVGERLLNLFFYHVPLGASSWNFRAQWMAWGGTLVLSGTSVATLQLIRNPRNALFDYFGSAYRSLGWSLAFYLSLIIGLTLVGGLQSQLLSAWDESTIYILVVSVLLVILGLWNCVFGLRILTRSLNAKENQALQYNGPLERFGLSARETEVTRLLAQGLVNKEVAQRLHVAESTVRNHVYSIYKKLGITNRGGLIRVLGLAAQFQYPEM